MVNVLLYCSYSGSAAGYQQAVVDESEKTVRRPRDSEIPKLVSDIWTHGGASAAAGTVEGTSYFLAKQIDYLNENKQKDEQGRKVFMNCAFTSRDHIELQQFAEGFLACFQAVVKKLGDLLVVDDSEIGYTILNFDQLREWTSFCVEAGKRVPTSRVGRLEQSISFIALEGDWAYFVKQNSNLSVPSPRNMIGEKEYRSILATSRKEFSLPEVLPPKWPEVPPAAEIKPGAGLPVLEVSRTPARPAPPAAREKKLPTPPESGVPQSGSGRMEELEKRVTELRRELAQEKSSAKAARQKAEEEKRQAEQKLKQMGFWVKAAAALSAASILLTLILHN